MYNETIDTLTKYYDRLDAVAKALLEREHLNREEFEAIMKGETIPTKKDLIEPNTKKISE